MEYGAQLVNAGYASVAYDRGMVPFSSGRSRNGWAREGKGQPPGRVLVLLSCHHRRDVFNRIEQRVEQILNFLHVFLNFP